MGQWSLEYGLNKDAWNIRAFRLHEIIPDHCES